MKYNEVVGLAVLSGIEHNGIQKIENPYWPRNADHEAIREASPWWIIHTDGGVITIGWRKRVIAIDWQNTKRRGIVTKDNVTKADDHVHAYSLIKALEYLKAWRELPVVDITHKDFKSHIVEGREQVIEAIRMLGDGSPELDLLKGLLDEVKDEKSVISSVHRVGAHHAFNIRVGNLHISHYPRGN